MTQTKQCYECNDVKPVEDFTRNSSRSDGLEYRCRDCKNKWQLEWREKNPEKYRQNWKSSDLRRKYGLSIPAFEELLDAQEHKCAICRDALKLGSGGHAIDHNHDTGEIRGILCGHCNAGLGLFKDSPLRLKLATEYLEHNGHYG